VTQPLKITTLMLLKSAGLPIGLKNMISTLKMLTQRVSITSSTFA